MVPFKKSGAKNVLLYQAVMGIGIALSGFALTLILGYSIALNSYALVSGFLWASANAIFIGAISELGLARAVPIASSLVILTSFLWGALAFNELPAPEKGFLGTGLIILGVILISAVGSMSSRNVKKGILAAAVAGLIWGSQLVPVKLGNVAPAEFFFPVCVGIFISAMLIFIAKRVSFKKEAFGAGLLSGFIWNIGNLLSLISLSIIGLAKTGPISQSSTFVAVLWGLIYFKEIPSGKAKIQVLIGTAIMFAGIAVLSMS